MRRRHLLMKTVTCPECGHQFDPDHKIIHLRQKLHFNIDLVYFRAAFDRAWRNSGAAHATHPASKKISTQEVATESGLSIEHCRRGLRVLAAAGEIKRVGIKAGWQKV